MDGFLLINKPKGMTSHDVVFKIKKKFHLDKVGHTGTLDPFASGLMILCLGKATKLAYLFSNLSKSYDGTIVFGNHYDTYDTTGLVEQTKIVELKSNEISSAMNHFIGTYDQLPPMYSAIKIKGKKLYEFARQGIEVERNTRQVEIFDYKMLKFINRLKCTFITSVSKGTYIRSLIVDLAEQLNTYAALETLNRLTVGSYSLNYAKTLEEVTKNDMISLEMYFKDYPVVVLNEYLIKLVKNGVYLDERQIETDQPFVVYDENLQMIAYYEVKNINQYKPVLIF